MCPATNHVAAANGELAAAKRWAIGFAAASLYTLAVHGGLEIGAEQRSLPPLPLASPRIPYAIGLIAALAVIAARRSDLRSMQSRRASRTAFSAACLGAVGFGWGMYAQVPEFAAAGLLASAISVAAPFTGKRGVQLLLSASAILVFCVPLPGALFNTVVASLQEATAAGAERVLAANGHAVARDGMVLTLPWRATSVIETCSGLRTIHMSVAIVVGYGVYSRASARRIALLSFGASILAALGNVLRVAWIAAQSEAVSESVHSAVGMASAGFACWCAACLDRLVPRSLTEARRVSSRFSDGARGAVSQRTLILPAVLAAGAWAFAQPAGGPARPEWRLELPFRIGPSVLAAARSQHRSRESLATSWSVQQTYRDRAGDVEVLAAYDDLTDRHRSLVAPVNALPGPDWDLAEQHDLGLTDPMRGTSTLARRFGERRLVWTVYVNATSRSGEIVRELLGLDRTRWARADGIRMLRLVTSIGPGEGGDAPARARLAAVLTVLTPGLLETGHARP